MQGVLDALQKKRTQTAMRISRTSIASHAMVEKISLNTLLHREAVVVILAIRKSRRFPIFFERIESL